MFYEVYRRNTRNVMLEWPDHNKLGQIPKPANHVHHYIKHNFAFSITFNAPKTMIRYYKSTTNIKSTNRVNFAEPFHK